jgi:hypothetical protein
MTRKAKPETEIVEHSGMTYMPAQVLTRKYIQDLPMAQTDPSIDMSAGDKTFSFGEPSESDMALINRLSPSGNIDPAKLFVFPSAISSSRIDSLLTRMDESSLKNYVQDAMLGVPVLNSHRSGGSFKAAELPLGRSYNAMLTPDPGLEGGMRAIAQTYMLRNNRSSNGVANTDDIIAGIEAGINSDISIGFVSRNGTPENNFEDRTWMRCSICGQDWLRADPYGWGDDPDVCQHWPGELYKSNGGKNTELCYLDVMNAGLGEYSLVYAGATDGAIVLKAKRAADAGIFNRSQLSHLEDVYNTRLLDRTNILFQGQAGQLAQLAKPISTGSDTSTLTITTDRKGNTDMPKEKEPKEETNFEEVRQDGARSAYANLIKARLDRATTDEENDLCKRAMDALASGNLELVTEILAGEVRSEQSAETIEGEVVEEGDETTPAETTPARSVDITFELTRSERQQFQAVQKENEAFKREIAQLKPLAEIGENYRAELVEEFTRQSIRAQAAIKSQGVPVPSEAELERQASRLEISDLKNQTALMKRIADGWYSNQDEQGNPVYQGGRQTVAGDPNTPNGIVRLNAPQSGRVENPNLYKSNKRA